MHPSRPVSFAFISALWGLAFVLASVGEGAAGERVRFGFRVEDGETWRKTSESNTYRDFKDRAPVSEIDVTSEVRLSFEVGTQGTATLILETLSAQTKLNGEVRDNPAQQLVVGKKTRLHLDKSGKAVAGDGFMELMRQFERDLDAETFSRVRGQISAKGMKQGEISRWNRPFDGLRGKEVEIGDTWLVLSERQLQGTVVALSGTLSFEGWTELDGFRALRVVYRFDTTGEEAKGMDSKSSPTLNLRPPDRKEYTPHNLVLEGETTWLLLPDRGLPLYETSVETMQVPFSADPTAEKGLVRQTQRFRLRPEPESDGS